MRNTTQYPITADEVMEVLEKIPQVNPPGTAPSAIRIGSLNDRIRRQIIDHFKDTEHMDALLKEMAHRGR